MSRCGKRTAGKRRRASTTETQRLRITWENTEWTLLTMERDKRRSEQKGKLALTNRSAVYTRKVGRWREDITPGST
jgi:hypothetical protein